MCTLLGVCLIHLVNISAVVFASCVFVSLVPLSFLCTSWFRGYDHSSLNFLVCYDSFLPWDHLAMMLHLTSQILLVSSAFCNCYSLIKCVLRKIMHVSKFSSEIVVTFDRTVKNFVFVFREESHLLHLPCSYKASFVHTQTRTLWWYLM